MSLFDNVFSAPAAAAAAASPPPTPASCAVPSMAGTVATASLLHGFAPKPSIAQGLFLPTAEAGKQTAAPPPSAAAPAEAPAAANLLFFNSAPPAAARPATEPERAAAELMSPGARCEEFEEIYGTPWPKTMMRPGPCSAHRSPCIFTRRTTFPLVYLQGEPPLSLYIHKENL